MGDQGVQPRLRRQGGRGGADGGEPGHDPDARHPLEHGPPAGVEAGHIEAGGSGGDDRDGQIVDGGSQDGRLDHPPPRHLGGADGAGEAGEEVRFDPAPLPNDALGGPVGAGPGRGQDRVDVEDLPAADGLGPTVLAEHVTVAGKQGQGDRQVDPDQAVVARFDGVGAEDAQPGGVLPAADVDGPGAPPRHGVVEVVEHGQ